MCILLNNINIFSVQIVQFVLRSVYFCRLLATQLLFSCFTFHVNCSLWLCLIITFPNQEITIEHFSSSTLIKTHFHHQRTNDPICSYNSSHTHTHCVSMFYGLSRYKCFFYGTHSILSPNPTPKSIQIRNFLHF